MKKFNLVLLPFLIFSILSCDSDDSCVKVALSISQEIKDVIYFKGAEEAFGLE